MSNENNEYLDINEMQENSDSDMDIIDENQDGYESVDDEYEEQKEKPSLSVTIFEWVQSMMNAIIVVIIILTFVFRLINVDGNSMQNTLQSGDKVLVTSFTSNYKYGDVVVLSRGEKLDKVLIKRVIATEGQIVDINTETGKVIVDNVELEESSYTKDGEGTYSTSDVEFPLTVPQGKLFVMGDNRAVSKDSRSSEVGFIDLDNVIGKAQLVVFPFDHFKSLNLE